MRSVIKLLYIWILILALPVFGNNYYIRTDLGFSSMRDSNLALGIGAPIYSSDVAYEMSANFNSVLSGQLGLGYRFYPFFRVDVTLQQYLHRSMYGECLSKSENVCGGQKQESGMQTVVSLLNGYLDFNPFMKNSPVEWMNPYIGLGLGFASNKFEDIEFYQDNLYVFEVDSATQGNYAWRLIAGMGFYISERVLIDIWYGFTNAGDALTGDNVAPASNTASLTPIESGIVHVRFQEGFAGLRFLF